LALLEKFTIAPPWQNPSDAHARGVLQFAIIFHDDQKNREKAGESGNQENCSESRGRFESIKVERILKLIGRSLG